MLSRYMVYSVTHIRDAGLYCIAVFMFYSSLQYYHSHIFSLYVSFGSTCFRTGLFRTLDRVVLRPVRFCTVHASTVRFSTVPSRK